MNAPPHFPVKPVAQQDKPWAQSASFVHVAPVPRFAVAVAVAVAVAEAVAEAVAVAVAVAEGVVVAPVVASTVGSAEGSGPIVTVAEVSVDRQAVVAARAAA